VGVKFIIFSGWRGLLLEEDICDIAKEGLEELGLSDTSPQMDSISRTFNGQRKFQDTFTYVGISIGWDRGRYHDRFRGLTGSLGESLKAIEPSK